MITVVGLGYGADAVSVKGLKIIERAEKLFVLTEKTAAGKSLSKFKPTYLDALFERAEDFDALEKMIVETLPDGCVYAVDGSGYTDGAAKRLVKEGRATVIAGAVEACDRALTLTAVDAVRAMPYLDTAAGLVVVELDDRLLAGDLKIKLGAFYHDDYPVRLNGKTIPLEAIDRQSAYGAETTLVIDGTTDFGKAKACYGDLKRMLERLTAPDGCPWDRAQTHESIRQNMIEEAYEAVDAIDSGDLDAMIEEFGDVYLQAALHCNIAERTGEFDTGEVLGGLVKKLYLRHTHVFGEVKAQNAGDALTAWDAAKAVEKQYESLYDILCRMPKGFPASLRAGKAVKKAVKFGADLTAEGLTGEAVAALGKHDFAAALFALVGASALSGVEPETAVNEKLNAFIERQK